MRTVALLFGAEQHPKPSGLELIEGKISFNTVHRNEDPQTSAAEKGCVHACNLIDCLTDVDRQRRGLGTQEVGAANLVPSPKTDRKGVARVTSYPTCEGARIAGLWLQHEQKQNTALRPLPAPSIAPLSPTPHREIERSRGQPDTRARARPPFARRQIVRKSGVICHRELRGDRARWQQVGVGVMMTGCCCCSC